MHVKIIVMGGGVIGVTTAYWLAQTGHEVQVLERNGDVGEETSFQNGALLAPGHSQSWAAPGALWTLAKSVFQKDPALRFRFNSDPQFWRWAMKFLANSTSGHYRANTLRVLRCMIAGLAQLRALSAETGVGYNGNDEGSTCSVPPAPLRSAKATGRCCASTGSSSRKPMPSDVSLSSRCSDRSST
jgi:D-amino-acid dehydrogenase